MKILPPSLKPPDSKFCLRHKPRPGDYKSFRNCLRWDFGFVCPFCLLHESDHARRTASSGLFWLEHLTTQSADEGLKNEYTNLAYSCKYCNRSRGASPRTRGKERLLNPVSDIWSEHFAMERDDSLTPLTPHAGYTADEYRINSSDKVAMRTQRRLRIEKWRAYIRNTRPKLPKLQALLKTMLDKHEHGKALEVIETISDLREGLCCIEEILSDFRAIPQDAPGDCRCEVSPPLSLPEQLEEQCWDLYPSQ